MSFGSAIFPSDPYRKTWAAEGEGGLVKQLYKAGQFLRGIRVQMRFGELTRAPLRLLRLQMIDDVVECDWLARSHDRWDADLSRNIQQRHASLQALRDAIDVRTLLFDLMPEIETAHLRAYREGLEFARDIIITGSAHRHDHTSREVHSLVMRAKVLGFRFDMEGDNLRNLSVREPTYSSNSPS